MSEIFCVAARMEPVFSSLDENFRTLPPAAKKFKFKEFSGNAYEMNENSKEAIEARKFHEIADEFTKLVVSVQVLVKNKHESIPVAVTNGIYI